jgi:hypothetical protein
MWHACEGREKCTRFWWESSKEKEHSKDRGVYGRMGSEWIFGMLAGGVKRIQTTQDRDRWKAFVYTMMNLRVLAPRS